MENLDGIAEKVLSELDAKNAVREQALARSRRVIQHASRVIRAVHRGEYERARELLVTTAGLVDEMKRGAAEYPDIYYAGYTQDALKEYAEASITEALISGKPLPDPDELGVDYAPYLNGLGEAVGELRRHVLDLIRKGKIERGETILQAMDEIYSVLQTVDYPDAITRGLRHTTDMVRGVTERTRGDLTMAVRQEQLQDALAMFEQRVGGT